jgi:hypothetical protein
MIVLVLLVATAGHAAATMITASPVPFTAPEGSAFNGGVATFTDDNPAATPADFTATIDWGDGTAVTAGTIGSSSAAFVVTGQHTYADEGSFTVTVTISDVSPGTGSATATTTGTITEADTLSGSPLVFSAAAGTSFTGPVATFSDTLTSNVPSDFTATINWGDATTTAGTISGGGGSFQVSGTHTYAGTGTFSVVVTLSDDAPGTATAQVTSTAHVGTSALSVTASSFTIAENAAFNGTVASFTDSNKALTAASFTATIAWGDGTQTAGTVAGSGGSFTVSGVHTYADEQTATFTVTVSENAPGTATGSATGTATVTEADVLTPTGPAAFTAYVGVAFNGTVATFTDSDAGNTAGDFTALINWGDATTSAGTVSGGSGTFTVSGTHTYAAPGSLAIAVTLTDDAPGTATSTSRGTATVLATPPPPPPPPPAAVPALDLRGLLLLGIALGAAGLYLLRRT